MSLTKIIGIGIICIINVFFIILGGIFLLEIYLKYNFNDKGVSLYQTHYYGEKLNQSPYHDLTIQYIHPYYMFSLPWQKKDEIKKNSVVSLNNDGFRKITGNLSKRQKLIFLGGSSAFGHFASSDSTTIGSYLNNLSSFEVVNRNAPSWNSHQEAIALFKYDYINQVAASISFSLANDISIICMERDLNNQRERLDFPESWVDLDNTISNIRGNKSLINSIKDVARKKLIPNTYPMLHDIKVRIFRKKPKLKGMPESEKEQSIKQNQLTAWEYEFYRCNDNHIEKVVKSYLANQIRMSKIAESYGFKHLLIIQPDLSTKGDFQPEAKFKKKIIKSVIDSQYCLENPCLDLSRVFENKGLYLAEYENIKHDQALREKWFESGIFIDSVHINDNGNKIIADHINSFLNIKVTN